jgi:hypothetical protein
LFADYLLENRNPRKKILTPLPKSNQPPGPPTPDKK